MMNWSFFPLSQFCSLSNAWQTIYLSGPANPLLSVRFIEPLINHFATGHEVIALCSREGEPIAITILQRQRACHWETFQPSQNPLGAWLQHSDIPIQSLLASLMDALPGLALVLGVTRQDPALITRPLNGGSVATLDSIDTARVLITGTFEDYWKARDGKLRQETNRRSKRLQSSNLAPRLEEITDAASVADAIRNFGTLESAGWKGREGTAIHADNEQGRFYTSLLQSFCSHSEGCIYRFWLGDYLAAMQLCVKGDRTLVFLKTTYDEGLRNHGPGILMQYEIMRHLYAKGEIDTVEFYGKTGEAQRKWCDGQIRALYHVNYYRWPWVANMREWVHGFRGRRALKQGSEGITEADSTAELAVQKSAMS